MQDDNFEALQMLIEKGQLPSDRRPNRFILAAQGIITKNQQLFTDHVKQFLHYLVEHQFYHLHSEQIYDCIDQITFMVCKHNKLYTFKGQKKAYCLTGKVINAYKRKKIKDVEDLEHREEFVSLVEQGVIRLFEDGKWMLHKNQKKYTLNDVLLQHDMPDSSTDQVSLTTEPISPFVPLQKSIVMLVPTKTIKPECLNFIKSSLLHVYLDEANLVSRIITKENFYKNSHLRGIYFIDEGEVEVNSGRILARGWTTYGKVKSSGFGWKFKPIPFIRFFLKNPLIWKQFINDIKMNDEYPFNIIHILGLNDDEDFTDKAEWKGLGRKKLGSKSPKLPRILNKTFDEEKYEEIERMRHYDNRLNDVFAYKQDLLTRKLKGVINAKFQPFYRDQKTEHDIEKRRNMILRMNSKRSDLHKKQTHNDTQNDNVLILSVLKRLQSINDINPPQKNKFSISYGATPNYILPKSMMKSKSKRQQTKITSMQIHSQLKAVKKSKRYN